MEFESEDNLVSEMKTLLRQKIIHIIHCVENSRTYSLSKDIDNTMEMLSQLSTLANVDDAIEFFTRGVELMDDWVNSDIHNSNIQLSKHTGARGRPSFEIPEELLNYFFDNGFKIPTVATMMGVSVSTIKRRMSGYGLSVSQTYSNLTDEDLGNAVREIQQEIPDAGYKTIGAVLLSKGHRLQRRRIRSSVKAVDPDGVLFRRLFLSVNRIHRRTYNVRAPRSLWHIDGNHKLIRYMKTYCSIYSYFLVFGGNGI